MKTITKSYTYSFGQVNIKKEIDELNLYRLMDNCVWEISGIIVGKKIEIKNNTTGKSIKLIARTGTIYVDISSILSLGNAIIYKIIIDGEEKSDTLYVSRGKSFPGDYPATKVYYTLREGGTTIPSVQMCIPPFGAKLCGENYSTQVSTGYQTITLNGVPKKLQILPFAETYNPNTEDNLSKPIINIEIKEECMRDSNSVAVYYENHHGERTVIVGQKVSHNHSRESQEYKRFSRSYKNLTATAAHKQIQTIDLVFVTDDPKRVRDLFLNSTVTLSNNDGDITASIVDSEIDLAKAGQMEEYRITFKILG